MCKLCTMEMMTSAIENGFVMNGDGCFKCTRQRKFEKVDMDSVPDLVPILKDRLPLSTNLFNIVKMHSKWSKEVTLYVLGGEISSYSWIIAAYQRGDGFGMEVCVSRPADSHITLEIREAFSKSSFIDWSEPFVFESVDTGVSSMITDISVREKGNITNCHPSILYYMDIEDAISLNEKFVHGEGVEVKSIDNNEGEKFILKTWKYTSKGSDKYVRTVLRRNQSAGVYLNDTIVAGVVFAVHGLLSMLYTLREHRGRGYAQSAMHLLIKRLAQEGLVPGAVVDVRNEASKAFQLKIGLKFGGYVDYIVFEKPTF